MGDPMDRPAPADLEAASDALLKEFDDLADRYAAQRASGYSDTVARATLQGYLAEHDSTILAGLLAAAVQRVNEGRTSVPSDDTESTKPSALGLLRPVRPDVQAEQSTDDQDGAS